MKQLAHLVLLSLALTQPYCSALGEENVWSRFRGENGNGQSAAIEIPSDWTLENNTAWTGRLPGIGHSSPVVWNDVLFVTSADSETGQHFVTAFNAITGEQLWQQDFSSEDYFKHQLNSLASSTPCVDAERLYVLWATESHIHLIALSHKGEPIWSQELAGFRGKHGFGTSPILVDGLLIVANDNDAESYVTALDCSTGEVRWTTSREAGKAAYGAPCVVASSDGGKQVVVASTASGITALNVNDGSVAWQVGNGLPERCVSSPVTDGKLVFVTCGGGGGGKLLVAVRPSSDGTAAESVYTLRRGVPYVPTPLFRDNLAFLWHDRGTVSCIDRDTGETHWNERLGGTYYGSPIVVGDQLMCVSTEGEVVTLAANREYELLGKRSLGEPSHATPAVANKRLYFRTESSVISIGNSSH